MFGHGETVLLYPYTGVETDAHGNRTPAWSDPQPIAGVGVGPTDSGEDRGEGERVTTGITLYLPFDVQITSQDKIEVRGEAYEVDGIPLAYRNPFTGWSPGATVSLRRVSG